MTLMGAQESSLTSHGRSRTCHWRATSGGGRTIVLSSAFLAVRVSPHDRLRLPHRSLRFTARAGDLGHSRIHR